MLRSRGISGAGYLLAVAVAIGPGGWGVARAAPPAGGPAPWAPSASSRGPSPEERAARRTARLEILAGYLVLSAAVFGGTYALRDNLLGRGLAVSSAGWGGLVVGATAGAALGALADCPDPACREEAQGVAGAVGGLLGAAAASLAASFLLDTPDSRVVASAAGMAPFFVVFSIVTVAEW